MNGFEWHHPTKNYKVIGPIAIDHASDRQSIYPPVSTTYDLESTIYDV